MRDLSVHFQLSEVKSFSFLELEPSGGIRQLLQLHSVQIWHFHVFQNYHPDWLGGWGWSTTNNNPISAQMSFCVSEPELSWVIIILSDKIIFTICFQ